MERNKTAGGYTGKSLKLAWNLAAWDYVLMLLAGLLDIALGLCVVFLTGHVFARLEICLEAGRADVVLYFLFGGYALCLFARGMYTVGYKRFYVQFYSLTAFEGRIRMRLHEKCGRISNEQFESPEIFGYTRQAQNASQNIYRLMEIVITIVLAAVNTVAITWYIASYNLLFGVFLLIAVIPNGIDLVSRTRRWKRTQARMAQLQREEEAYTEALVSARALKETRVFGAQDFLIGKWWESRKDHAQIEKGTARRLLGVHMLLLPLRIVGENAGVGVSLVLLLTGKVDFGGFSAGMAAYVSLKAAYGNLFEMVGSYFQWAQMVQPFFRFMDLPERGRKSRDDGGGTSPCGRIVLEDVSFRYPNGKEDAISHVSLCINRGETIAVVGENGAGKTTLTHLIMGLFRPGEGRVFHDGTDICMLGEDELYKGQTALFQKFNCYQASVLENITFADKEESDLARVQELLRELFADREELAADVMLGKEFGGRELSGGQWQTLALARGVYKQAGFIVMDEPTSAVDSFREQVIYELFRRNVEGRTGLIVTHRLGAVSLADRIIVLDKGRILEEGTHAQLLEKGGKYAEFWNAQAGMYSDYKKTLL